MSIGAVLNEKIETEGELPDVEELRSAVITRVRLRGDSSETPLLAYLSGDIRPDDRQLIIDALYDEDTETEPLIDRSYPVLAISTSIVEAGVDISFERVYRDIAPIPNIVQSGGRCNRSFEGDLGQVVVWELGPPPERNRLPSKVIHGWDYDDSMDNLPLLHATRSALTEKDGTVISEGEMVGEVVDRYYRHVNTQYDPGSTALVNLLRNCEIDTLADERMIKDIDDYEDIIVCSTDYERAVGGFSGGQQNQSILVQETGTHLSAKPPATAKTTTIGNSTYHIVDSRSTDYDPVFGLESNVSK